MMGVQEVDKVDVNGYGFRVVHLMGERVSAMRMSRTGSEGCRVHGMS